MDEWIAMLMVALAVFMTGRHVLKSRGRPSCCSRGCPLDERVPKNSNGAAAPRQETEPKRG